ncbi:DUF5999 family protein [Streptomyces bacillaris]|uniref:DUF5999 family protein n=1 Tax=Streptomyces bacillaris TaxID=68179 RepID=UPI000515DD74
MPRCPSADSPDRVAARVVGRDDGVGSTWLCNGVVLFEDTGGLLPGGEVIEPHRLAYTGPAS